MILTCSCLFIKKIIMVLFCMVYSLRNEACRREPCNIVYKEMKHVKQSDSLEDNFTILNNVKENVKPKKENKSNHLRDSKCPIITSFSCYILLFRFYLFLLFVIFFVFSFFVFRGMNSQDILLILSKIMRISIN